MGGKTAAGFVIFRRFNEKIQYLLLQASYEEHHWTPPKGHVDKGETDELVTAFRETEEEAGFKKEHLRIFPDSKKTLVYNVKGKPKTVFYWLAELIDPNTPVILSDEHIDFKWLPLKEACILGKYDDAKQLLEFCEDYINKNL